MTNNSDGGLHTASPFWRAHMNPEPSMSIRAARLRTEALPMAGLVAPTSVPIVPTPLSAHAAELGLKEKHVDAVKSAIDDIVKFTMSQGSLGTIRNLTSTTDYLKSVAENMKILQLLRDDSCRAQRLSEADLFGELTTALIVQTSKGAHELSAADYAGLLKEKKHKDILKDRDPYRVLRYLKRMYRWRHPSQAHEQQTAAENAEEDMTARSDPEILPRMAIIAFRNPTLDFVYLGHGTNNSKAAEAVNEIWGKYMDDLLHFPFIPQDQGQSLENDRRLWFQLVGFPGADDEGFSTSGAYWHDFTELVNFLKDFGGNRKIGTFSDEIVQTQSHHSGKRLKTHLLLPFRDKNQWKLTVAARVEAGEILGLVPGRLRYQKSEAPTHWIRLPNGVRFEPTPSPFTMIFADHGEDYMRANVVIGYDWVDDLHSGLGPSFRLYVVALQTIQPLDFLTT